MKLNKCLIIAMLSALAASGLSAKEKPNKEAIPGVAPKPVEFFYTGKPYDKDLGAYTFNYRSYDPELKRWTAADPSGFPDGANNMLYVNNLVFTAIDKFGLDIYHLNNPTAVGGNGHSGAIVGNDSMGYYYYSYGRHKSLVNLSAGDLTEQRYDTLEEAMTGAKKHAGYERWQRWQTDPIQDVRARRSAIEWGSDNYNLTMHNCVMMVESMLRTH